MALHRSTGVAIDPALYDNFINQYRSAIRYMSKTVLQFNWKWKHKSNARKQMLVIDLTLLLACLWFYVILQCVC